jgi:hypothetical protein
MCRKFVVNRRAIEVNFTLILEIRIQYVVVMRLYGMTNLVKLS